MGLCVLCPGQGNQHPQMLQLLEGNHAAQRVLDEAAAALGEDPRDWLRLPHDLHLNRIAQPLLCMAQLATWAALRDRLPPARLFAGYSIGELAAYACAGAIGSGELAGLARHRAVLMDNAGDTPSSLLAVSGLDRGQIEALCQTGVGEIAIVNGHDRFVLGAPLASLTGLQHAAEAMGDRASRLPVAVASHTAYLADASEAFRHHLADSGLKGPSTPVLAGISGLPVRSREAAIDALARQISTQLNWAACLDVLPELGCRLVLELGPANALSRMVRERWPDMPARSVSEFHSLQGVVDWVERWLKSFE
jgi:[acyl-carrier-protein] S-malonyltransferase